MGVITRNFDMERIKSEFILLDKRVKEMEKGARKAKILAMKKAYASLPAIRKTRNLLENILGEKFCFQCAGKYYRN